MRYLKIDNNFLELSKFRKDIVILLLEVDNKGTVKKEIGLNEHNQIVHVYPSQKFKFGKYGIFDLNIFELTNLKDDISREKFYFLWDKC